MVFSPGDDREVLVSQINSLRDYVRLQSAEIAELRNTEAHIKTELQRREDERNKIFSSPTWKVGRLVLSPLLLVRALLRSLRKS